MLTISRVSLLLLLTLLLNSLDAQLSQEQEQQEVVINQAYKQELATIDDAFHEKFGRDCEQPFDFIIERLKTSSGSTIRVRSVLIGQPFELTTLDGHVLASATVSKEPSGTIITIAGKDNLILRGPDRCGAITSIAEVPYVNKPSDPIDVDRTAYSVIRRWQKSQTPLTEILASASEIDNFTKTYLLQRLVYDDRPLDETLNFIVDLPAREDFKGESMSTKMDDCQCYLIRIAMNSLLSPIRGTYDNGVIYGQYDSNTGQKFHDSEISANQYWAYEGPSRYQGMYMRTDKCANAPYDFSWNRDAVTDDEEPVMAVQHSASIDFNWVCRNSRNVVEDCACDRTVDFSWDYESAVIANAEIIRGGWGCGSGRRAMASTVDAMAVGFVEVNNPSSYRTLALQLNGQFSECSQTYTGPTAAEVAQFAFTIFQLTQEFESNPDNPRETETVWRNRLIGQAINQAGEALSDPWMQRVPCSAELSGQRRSLQGSRQSRSFNTILSPNNPVRIVLGSNSTMLASGRRKWQTRNELWSSFRLAGMLTGGGSPYRNNDCCSPFIGAWQYATIADDVPGGATANDYRAATRAFFNQNGVLPRISRPTGDFVDYQGFYCPTRVIKEIVRPGDLTGGFSEVFAVKSKGGELIITTNNDIALSGDTRLSIYNIKGQQMGSYLFEHSLNQSIISPRLTPGLYVVVANFDDGTRMTKKIVHF